MYLQLHFKPPFDLMALLEEATNSLQIVVLLIHPGLKDGQRNAQSAYP